MKRSSYPIIGILSKNLIKLLDNILFRVDPEAFDSKILLLHGSCVEIGIFIFLFFKQMGSTVDFFIQNGDIELKSVELKPENDNFKIDSVTHYLYF